MQKRAGFTLIELLIVVAIIAILAAIAVPNFIEAQTRSKVSRVKADLRTIKTGLESYAVDHGTYPHLKAADDWGYGQNNRGGIVMVTNLTTPVAYLTTVQIKDPFAKTENTSEFGDIIEPNSPDPNRSRYLNYINIKLLRAQTDREPIGYPQYGVMSYGPDYVKGPDARTGGQWLIGDYGWMYGGPPETHNYAEWQYDATNGTKSQGDIIMWQ